MKRYLPLLFCLLPMLAQAMPLCDFRKTGANDVLIDVGLHQATDGQDYTGLTPASSGLTIRFCPDVAETCNVYSGAEIQAVGTRGTYLAPTVDVRFGEHPDSPGTYQLQSKDSEWSVANARWVTVHITTTTTPDLLDFKCKVFLDPVTTDEMQAASAAAITAADLVDVGDIQGLANAAVLHADTVDGLVSQTVFSLANGPTVNNAFLDAESGVGSVVVGYDAVNLWPSRRRVVAYDGATQRMTINAAFDFTLAEDDMIKVLSPGQGPDVTVPMLKTTVAAVTSQTVLDLTTGSTMAGSYIDAVSGVGAVVVGFDASNNNYPSIRRVSAYAGTTARTMTIDAAFDFTVTTGDGIRIYPWVTGNFASIKTDTMAILDDTGTDGVAIANDGITAAKVAADVGAEFADATWDEAIAGHVAAGSTGEALDNAGAAGTPPTVEEIADQVWDEAQASHVTAGSFGEVATEVAAILVDTGTTLDGKIDTIDGNVDAVLVDTSTTLDGKLNTIDTNVDAVLVDTAEIGAAGAGLTTLASQASVDTVDANVDAILLDTGTDGVMVSSQGAAVILGAEVESVGGYSLKDFASIGMAVLAGETEKGPGDERRHMTPDGTAERLFTIVDPTTLERTTSTPNPSP